VNRSFPGATRRLAAGALAVLASVVLASCGSGAVSSTSATTTSGPITITPPTATLYADLPTVFVVNGGNGSYIVTSSDQQVVPAVGSLKGPGPFTVVPNQVPADTPVTLTVSDTAGSTPASAALTVKPRTVSNVVTVTPSASQSAACGTAICSGGDAEVKVVLSQAGVPLVGRTVRFDVVSGDVRIIDSAPGAPETLALSGTTTTDSTGTARIRVRVLSDATSQTALLQITDVSSGFTQRTSVAIAPGSNAPLNAQPSTIVFQGVDAGTCASGIRADVIVFGGRPPYLVSQPGSFSVSPTIITSNGGRFTVGATGQCTSGSQIAVVDANGATVSVTASNTLSALPPPVTTTPFQVTPSSAVIASCNTVVNFTLSGGSGSYFGTSADSRLDVRVNGNVGSVQAKSPSSWTTAGSSTTKITFSDGKTSAEVSVDASAFGPPGIIGNCP
jgi:hypothetical protein